ncbi:MAG TPA: zinc ribbon domain-containing protein [Chloroflexi bacterium]|nr:zinc ribbon domain-containing protein [Chloroflexota bacterium]
MPLYEYVCGDCGERFEALRPMREADAPIECPHCGGQHAKRALSLFAAIGSEGVIAGNGSSCTSCSATSCAGCSSRQ